MIVIAFRIFSIADDYLREFCIFESAKDDKDIDSEQMDDPKTFTMD
jgi:hypothetical protein